MTTVQFRVINEKSEKLYHLMTREYPEKFRIAFVGRIPFQNDEVNNAAVYDINDVAVFAMSIKGDNERVMMIGEDYKIEPTQKDIEQRTGIGMEVLRTVEAKVA